eukprot:gene44573-18353_t
MAPFIALLAAAARAKGGGGLCTSPRGVARVAHSPTGGAGPSPRNPRPEDAAYCLSGAPRVCMWERVTGSGLAGHPPLHPSPPTHTPPFGGGGACTATVGDGVGGCAAFAGLALLPRGPFAVHDAYPM